MLGKREPLLSVCKDVRQPFEEFPYECEIPSGDVHIIGVAPLYVGVEGEDLIFPYTKPCHGTFVVKVPGGEEIARLRERKK